MKSKDLSRRKFVTVVSAGSTAVMSSGTATAFGSNAIKGKLAILGGDPVRKDKPWHSWPFIDSKCDRFNCQYYQKRRMVQNQR